ncbi:MAG: GMC family oxidoreductase, partial [Candidatus Marithrix sp.]|nr:GMC family oxidoreductase [Candidatus Marithrix sp.]
MENFDVIIIGTSFASSFFLHGYLSKVGKQARILVLERGKDDSHQWQLQHKRRSSVPSEVVNTTPHKTWPNYLGFGGTSRAWVACTPRMMPSDLQLKSKYGVGVDWPVSYDELEQYYTEAEMIMAVSGPDANYPFPRSQAYPQPPHQFNDFDKLLKQTYPDLYFQQPVARARVTTANRPMCCATGVCTLCPADAKFTIQNEMAHLYQDSRVNLLLEAEALAVETEAGQATGVRYRKDGKEQVAKADLIVLGANAIFNPYLLQRSNLPHPMLGKRLHEQVSQYVKIDLDGVNNFQGSTMITGHGYMLYDGPHR